MPDKYQFKKDGKKGTLKQVFDEPRSEYYHYVSGGLITGDPSQPGIQSHINPEWDEYFEKEKYTKSIPVQNPPEEWKEGDVMELNKDFEIKSMRQGGDLHDYAYPIAKEQAKPDCSQHPKDLFGETDMKVVAERIGDLHYETLSILLTELQKKIFKDALKDKAADRIRLSDVLMKLSTEINCAAYLCEQAWQISKQFMK